MILPDNIKPEDTLYFCGYQILKILKETEKLDIDVLYIMLKEKELMSYSKMLLSLDWLFLIEAIKYNQKGEIQLCLSRN